MEEITRDYIIEQLKDEEPEKVALLYKRAYQKKVETIGEKVYLRGLIEVSNICRKNCLYCGLRSGNHHVSRYELTTEQILEAAKFAMDAGYGSIAIQGGERSDPEFISKITDIILKIKLLSINSSLGITLSLGEQKESVYSEWFNAGAHRYLLRIESSTESLYQKLHPNDSLHSFYSRIKSLEALKRVGYQVGTGVMIGVPFQTIENLADDLLFFKEFDIDMCGMGPYIPHHEAPLYQFNEEIPSAEVRLERSLKMIALLRLLMPDINIVATTALQVLDSDARESGILAGANIIMPNMTLPEVRSSYSIYDNKPGLEEDAHISRSRLEENLAKLKIPIGWNQWGDSMRFASRSS